MTETIEVETAKSEISQDEHSIAAYFQKYGGADMTNEAIRDEVLDYFIDKIYVYDDQLVFTGGYYGRDGQWHSKVVYDDVWQEVKFEGFESFAVGLTNGKPSPCGRVFCWCYALRIRTHGGCGKGTDDRLWREFRQCLSQPKQAICPVGSRAD